MRYTRLKRQLEAEEAEEARLAGYSIPVVNSPVIRRRKKRKNTDDEGCESGNGGSRVKKEGRGENSSGEGEDGEGQGARSVKRERVDKEDTGSREGEDRTETKEETQKRIKRETREDAMEKEEREEVGAAGPVDYNSDDEAMVNKRKVMMQIKKERDLDEDEW